jgi:hypothetical protein
MREFDKMDWTIIEYLESKEPAYSNLRNVQHCVHESRVLVRESHWEWAPELHEQVHGTKKGTRMNKPDQDLG